MNENDRMTARLLTLPENTAGRDFVVSDIHGYFDALDAALATRAFDAQKDRLVSVGDLIDRGPQSPRALHYLAQPWFFCVRGNHEQAMLDWLNPLLAGAAPAIVRDAAMRHASFGGDWVLPLLTRALHPQQPDTREAAQWQQALGALPLAIEIPRKGERIGVVHATVPGGDWAQYENRAPLDEPLAPGELATFWHRRPLDDAPEQRVRGIDRVYAGHNVVDKPEVIGNLHMIETGAWKGRALTLIDLDDKPAPKKRWRLFL